MTETGHVISVSGDSAIVAMRMSGDCKKCGLCMKSSDGKELHLLARNEVDAAQGDVVEIEISPGRVLVAAFAVYMIPVLMTIVGFVVGSSLAEGSEESFLPIGLAMAFLVTSFVIVWLFDRRIRKTDRKDAVIRRVLSEDEVEKHRVQVVKFGG